MRRKRSGRLGNRQLVVCGSGSDLVLVSCGGPFQDGVVIGQGEE